MNCLDSPNGCQQRERERSYPSPVWVMIMSNSSVWRSMSTTLATVNWNDHNPHETVLVIATLNRKDLIFHRQNLRQDLKRRPWPYPATPERVLMNERRVVLAVTYCIVYLDRLSSALCCISSKGSCTEVENEYSPPLGTTDWDNLCAIFCWPRNWHLWNIYLYMSAYTS